MDAVEAWPGSLGEAEERLQLDETEEERGEVRAEWVGAHDEVASQASHYWQVWQDSVSCPHPMLAEAANLFKLFIFNLKLYFYLLLIIVHRGLVGTGEVLSYVRSVLIIEGNLYYTYG